MSTASHAASGQLSFGGLLSRIFFILVLWTALVYGMLHYVGYVIPKAYQVSQARSEAAETAAKALAEPELPTPVAAAPAAGSAIPTAPAASASAPTTATPAPAAASAAPATAAGSATPAAAPAAGSAAPTASANKPLPKDILLAGFNRTALTNVARFYSIVISFFCVGAIILQVFKYKHVEEEHAH